MHPVMSDLQMFVAGHEAEAELAARQRAALVRQAVGTGGAGSAFSILATTVLNATRQFFDPRGYAMAQLRKRPVETVEAVSARVAAPVVALTAPAVEEPAREAA